MHRSLVKQNSKVKANMFTTEGLSYNWLLSKLQLSYNTFLSKSDPPYPPPPPSQNWVGGSIETMTIYSESA